MMVYKSSRKNHTGTWLPILFR